MNSQSFKTKIPRPIIIYLVALTILVLSFLSLSIILNLYKSGITVKTESAPQNFAFLVALSKGYENYRHQSDIFRAYNILRKSGIKADNIITFAYNDVANHKYNPYPGKVFNKPDVYGEGKDNYELVKNNIDYQLNELNRFNILNALSGKTSIVMRRKTLQTTSKDNIFIFMSGHGGTGFLLLADGSKLFADQLNTVLQALIDKKSFNKLVFYLESCESGSMFDGYIKSDSNVYAVSASDPYTPSYATFCYDGVINKKRLNTCLGDAFANNWMDSTEREIEKKNFAYSLEHQWIEIRTTIQRSNPQSYGNFTIKKDSIFEFHTNKTYVKSKDSEVKASLIDEEILPNEDTQDDIDIDKVKEANQFITKPNYKILYLKSIISDLKDLNQINSDQVLRQNIDKEGKFKTIINKFEFST